MNEKVKISAAGNVEIPAYLTLIDKGYEVSWHRDKKNMENETWMAIKNGIEFYAEGPIELLGVVGMYEARGHNWKASDKQIDDFLTKYEK